MIKCLSYTIHVGARRSVGVVCITRELLVVASWHSVDRGVVLPY